VSWSEFLFALINDEARMRTAPLAVASLMTKDGIQFQWVGSHLLLVLVPPVLLALGARRFVVRAMSCRACPGVNALLRRQREGVLDAHAHPGSELIVVCDAGRGRP